MFRPVVLGEERGDGRGEGLGVPLGVRLLFTPAMRPVSVRVQPPRLGAGVVSTARGFMGEEWLLARTRGAALFFFGTSGSTAACSSSR